MMLPFALAAVQARHHVVARLVTPDRPAKDQGVAVVLLRDHLRVGVQVLAVALAELGRHRPDPLDDIVANREGLVVAEDLDFADVLRGELRRLRHVLEELHPL